MSTVHLAVILAAGVGSRLQDVVNDRPKGFLEIHGQPIIEASIAKLIRAGISQVIIVTGYLHEFYEELAIKYPFVCTVKNQAYATTGSMASLKTASSFLSSDFLLLESDLVYEDQALSALQNCAQKNVILLSGLTDAGDEVYVGVEDKRVVSMSKDIREIQVLGGELVGISKISVDLYLKMIAQSEQVDATQYQYEDCLTDVNNLADIGFHTIDDLIWGEIDDSSHLQRVTETVYPLLLEKESLAMIEKNPARKVLLNPGPATTTESVKAALVVEDICPREDEFGALVENIRQDLVKIAHGEGEYECVLFASSGTGAVEACLSSVVPEDKSVLIINNGAYGERMQQICQCFGISSIEYSVEWGKPIDFSALESMLTEHQQDLSHIAFVHHETTVGLLNSIDKVCELATRYNLETIVDAMSSFAGIPIDVKKQNIHYLVSSSNKCIQGMAGIGIVICKRDSLNRSREIRKRNFYFNLYENYRFFNERKEMQFTPPVQLLYALRQAINEYFLETEQGRADRYTNNYAVLTAGLEKLGFEFLLDKEHHAKILTAIVEPDDKNYSFTAMHDYLYERGFTIYPGKGGKRDTFRLANMGAIDSNDINQFLHCLEHYMLASEITLGSMKAGTHL